MAVMIVKLVVPDGMSARDVQILLGDAVAEFRAARGPTAEAYVDRRYPLPEYASIYGKGPSRDAKVAEVGARRLAAKEIIYNGIRVTKLRDGYPTDEE